MILAFRESDSFSLSRSPIAKSVVRRKSGLLLLFTALYLKQCATSLQLYYGGVPQAPSRFYFPISLTRSGIPTILSSFHRIIIRQRDDRADRLYLSWFVSWIRLCKKQTFLDRFLQWSWLADLTLSMVKKSSDLEASDYGDGALRGYNLSVCLPSQELDGIPSLNRS